MLRNRRQDDVRFVLFSDWTTGRRSLSGFSTSVSSDARDLTQKSYAFIESERTISRNR